jgi:outer membrane protein
MITTRSSTRLLALGVIAGIVFAAPAVLADDMADIGFVDQSVLATVPAFTQANQQLQTFGNNLRQQFIGRARGASQAQQQQLAQEFQAQLADKQREVLGPIFRKAQIAVASVASSKNLSVVVDKRVIIYGGQDITASVRDLLTGAGDPVPPVNTPRKSTRCRRSRAAPTTTRSSRPMRIKRRPKSSARPRRMPIAMRSSRTIKNSSRRSRRRPSSRSWTRRRTPCRTSPTSAIWRS